MAESSSRPTANMSSLVVTNPDEIWDSHRNLLEEKYVKDGWPLHKVMTYMDEEHGFVAKYYSFPTTRVD